MADYVGVLADLKARRVALQQEQTELETAIAAIERLVRRSSSAPLADVTLTATARVAPLPPQGAFAELTMPKALEAYFLAVERPTLKTMQVVNGLVAAGVKDGGHLRGHVYNTLQRLSQNGGPFVRHTDGRWSLREGGSASQGQPGIFAEGPH